MKYIVYITINLCNGKFYIGVHKTNPDTFDGYIGCGIYRASNVKPKLKGLHSAVKKYGYENFKRTTIAIFDTLEEAYMLEKTLVNKTLLKSRQVYNLAVGGAGSIQEETKKRVYMFDLKGNFLRSYACTLDAASDLTSENVISAQHNIRNVCLENSPSALGYFWSYVKEFKDLNKLKVKVAQYSISGKYIRYWDSIAEAERELGAFNIYQAIIKKGSAVNYQWRYFTGDTSDINKLINVSTRNKTLPIIMFNGEGSKFYNCVLDCVKENEDLKLSVSQINRVLNKIIKSHKGFSFKYQDEDIV